MQYRKDKYGKELSILGYGCMRFTKKGGSIDIDKAEKEIMAAYEAGVNYYDTAYIYSGSEAALGEILERNHIREKVNIATKLPQYMISNRDAIDRYFDEELKRLRTTYVDYYLMHMLTDIAQWEKLKELGIFEWIKDKKEKGIIRNIGFSYHGNTDNFLLILSDYDWDFCQVQYNYMDDVSQAGAEGVKAASAHNIPVIIMEPLRGGKLVDMLPDDAKAVIDKNEHKWSAAEWAFRWLYDQKEVTVVLSGMNSAEMVEENCRIAGSAAPGHLTEEDKKVYEELKKAISANEKVGCTGCRYCMPCPKGVDIPGTFHCYNLMYTDSKNEGRYRFAQTVGLTKEPAFPSQCVACGRCEKHCPQNIPIISKLKEADKELRPFIYRVTTALIRKFMFRKAKK